MTPEQTAAQKQAKDALYTLVVYKDQYDVDHPAVVMEVNADNSLEITVFHKSGSSIPRSKVAHGFDLGQWHGVAEPVPAATPRQVAAAQNSVHAAQSAVDSAQAVVDNQPVPTVAAKAALADAKKVLDAATKLHADVKQKAGGAAPAAPSKPTQPLPAVVG